MEYFRPVTVLDTAKYKRFNYNDSPKIIQEAEDPLTNTNLYLYWEKLSLSKLCRLDIMARYTLLYSDIIGEIRSLQLPAFYAIRNGLDLVEKSLTGDIPPEMLARADSKILIPSDLLIFRKFDSVADLPVKRFPERAPFSDLVIYVMPGSIPARCAGLGVIPNPKSITGKESNAPSVILACQTRFLSDIGAHDISIGKYGCFLFVF